MPDDSLTCPECGAEQAEEPKILDDSFFAGPNSVTEQERNPQSFSAADIAPPTSYYNKLNDEGFHSGGDLYTPDFQKIVMLSNRDADRIPAEDPQEFSLSSETIVQMVAILLLGIAMVCFILAPTRRKMTDPNKMYADVSSSLANYLIEADLFDGTSLLKMWATSDNPDLQKEPIWVTDAYGESRDREAKVGHWTEEYVPIPSGLNFYTDDNRSTLTYENGILHVDDKLWGKKYAELKKYFAMAPAEMAPMSEMLLYTRSVGLILASQLTVYYPEGSLDYTLFFQDERLVAVRMTEETERYKIPDEVFEHLGELYGDPTSKRMNIYTTSDYSVIPTESGYTDCRWLYPLGERTGFYSLYIEITDGQPYFINQITSPYYYLNYVQIYYGTDDAINPKLIIFPEGDLPAGIDLKDLPIDYEYYYNPQGGEVDD